MNLNDLMGKRLTLTKVTDTFRGGAQSTCLTFQVKEKNGHPSPLGEVKVSFSPYERGGDLSCTVRQSIPSVGKKEKKGISPAIVAGLMEDDR